MNRNFDGRHTMVFWSTAFISFIVMNAGAAYEDFKFSHRHSTYIYDAIVKKELGETAPFRSHRLEDYAPQLRNMVAQ